MMVSTQAEAFTHRPTSERRNTFYVELGKDVVPLQSQAGYAFRFTNVAGKRDLVLSIDWTWAWVGRGLRDARVELGAQMSIIDIWAIELSAEVDLFAHRLKGECCTAMTYGTGVALLGGFFFRVPSVAAEVGYDHTFASRVRGPSGSEGRAEISGTLRVGVRAGLQLKAVELVLRGGFLRPGRPLSFLPGTPTAALPPYYLSGSMAVSF
jgi:hypothetical protein